MLGIFAHPDDETFCAGGTFANYAQRGAEIMVVSATRGQAGQIRDAAVGTRRTIAAVRESELRLACGRLGIANVCCLDHVDGALADERFSALVAEIAEITRGFQPDVVISFGPDGGYGHPDHVTISAVATAACRRAAVATPHPDGAPAASPARPPRLFYRYFPPSDLLILERLAIWLTSRPTRFVGTAAYANALLLLTEAAGTMRHIRDHSQVRWYAPGSYVVEQGEAATELFLILSGEAEVFQEAAGGRERLRRLRAGEFFGELGIARQQARSANVVACTALTCLVLSPAPPSKFAGRGCGARLTDALPGAGNPAAEDVRAAQGIVSCDVSGQALRKVEALSAYRSQFPLEPDMFPESLLTEMFGREYFIPAAAGPSDRVDPGHPRSIAGPRPSMSTVTRYPGKTRED